MNEYCPYCGRDPYHYEDVGTCYVPVAIVCCEAMIGLQKGEKKAKQILRLRRRGTPRSVKRAKKILLEYYINNL